MATTSFKDYVLSGRFNKVASDAVANAIARTKAYGLPVEGVANTDAPAPKQRAAQGATDSKKKDPDPRRMTAAEQEPDGEQTPRVIVFAGPNGSGKSTINQRVLQDPEMNFQGEYINADDIAKGLATEIPDYTKRNIKAAELAEERRQLAIKEGRPFAMETVMSTPEKVGIMTQAKAKGYDVTLVFVTTNDPELNVARVANRVAMGEHPVEPDTIRRRYVSTMQLLPCAVEHADAALVIDNSGGAPVDVALKADGQLHQLTNNPPAWVADKLVKPYLEREASRNLIEKAYEAQCARGDASLPAVIVDAEASHGKTYRGKIIETTPHHVLQQTGANKFVIHDRSLSAAQDLQKGKQATIGYAYEKGKIVAPLLDKGAPSKGIQR